MMNNLDPIRSRKNDILFFFPQMEDLGFGDPQSQKRTAGKAVDPEAAVQFKIVSRS
jgi:hypothetical protein